MKGSQWILIIVGVTLIVGLYSLPKATVSKKQMEKTNTSSNNTDDKKEETPLESLNKKDSQKIASWQNKYKENRSISLLDSIILTYRKNMYHDSAIQVAKFKVSMAKNIANLLTSGQLCIEAAGIYPARQAKYLDEARAFLNEALSIEPDNINVKNQLALTYMTTAEAMKGVLLLREVLDKDPDNEEATYILGEAAIRSGQWDKAIARFEKLTSRYAQDARYWLYLGIAYQSTNNSKALDCLTKAKTLTKDEQILSLVDEYIGKIK